MAYNARLGYDPEKDYSAELVKDTLSNAERQRLSGERSLKIRDMYSGEEPEYKGTGKTFTQLYGNDGSMRSARKKQYDPDVDYSAVLTGAISRNNKDADYLQDLLNSRIAKEKDPMFSQWENADFDRSVQSYIDSLREREARDGNAPRSGFYSEWDDTANELAMLVLGMDYDDWTQGGQYQALADRYSRSGQAAMQDVLGQISARTGGLASSYATTAAQQQYNEYIQQLEEVARQMYDAERGDALENLQLARGFAESDYGRYLDELDRYDAEREYQYRTERDRIEDDRYARQYGDEISEAAQRDARDRIAAYLELNGSLLGFDQELIDMSGYSDAELSAMERYYTGQQAAAVRTARSSGGSTTTGIEDENGEKWNGVEQWVSLYGDDAAEDYISEHYNALGYSNKSKALAAWRNHLRTMQNEEGAENPSAYSGQDAEHIRLLKEAQSRARAGASEADLIDFIADQIVPRGIDDDEARSIMGRLGLGA